jgi:uncharacterized protein
MSLTASPDLLDQARHGDDTAFTACIQDSLPYAWHLVGDLAGRMRATRRTGRVPGQAPGPFGP